MPGLFLGAGNIASKQNRDVLVLEGLFLQQEVIFKERPLRSLNRHWLHRHWFKDRWLQRGRERGVVGMSRDRGKQDVCP